MLFGRLGRYPAFLRKGRNAVCGRPLCLFHSGKIDGDLMGRNGLDAGDSSKLVRRMLGVRTGRRRCLLVFFLSLKIKTVYAVRKRGIDFFASQI